MRSLAFAVLFLPVAAWAAPMPRDVEAMLRAARGGDDLAAVAKVAKAAYPTSAAEIDALVSEINAEAAAAREQRLAQAGVFDAWSGNGQAGLTRTTGNTNDLGLAAGLALTKDGLVLRHKLTAAMDRQTTGGVLTRNKYLAGYELDYKFSQRLFAFGSFAWDKDTFAGIDRQFSESGGLGYSLLDTTTMKLDLTAGQAFRQTRYAAAPSENVVTAKLGADFSWKVFEAMTLTENAEWFIGNEIRSVTALSVPVRGKLSAQVAFDATRKEKVPAGRNRTDTTTRLGLVYSF
ncbi:MAG: DUF481 domain-containing protein [Rhodospirillaceae bacterium]|nr:DUF481 domain-containing protein [Rhodospirillaceae bacterium]